MKDHRISQKITEDFDVEAMLEAPFRKKLEDNTNKEGMEIKGGLTATEKKIRRHGRDRERYSSKQKNIQWQFGVNTSYPVLEVSRRFGYYVTEYT
ncbi:hypothetical protein JTE90_015194 [Oedothorax gibbosus]|uniref:Uncharacterized protein n=1 Tax=Oedothorax gibbosus TaxID=931172 RepID=A0AAV6V7G9_9ARAC|nr:hypothetical protein JTE90_015194 [Oedothorax gibbosus]